MLSDAGERRAILGLPFRLAGGPRDLAETVTISAAAPGGSGATPGTAGLRISSF